MRLMMPRTPFISFAQSAPLILKSGSRKPPTVLDGPQRNTQKTRGIGRVRIGLRDCLQQWDPQLSVQDVSMYRCAPRTIRLPREFSIVAESSADNSSLTSVLCDPSASSSIAQVLTKAGCAEFEDPPFHKEPLCPSRGRIHYCDLQEYQHGTQSTIKLILPNTHTLRLHHLLAILHSTQSCKQSLSEIWNLISAFSPSLSIFSPTAVAIMTAMIIRHNPKLQIHKELVQGFLRTTWSDIVRTQSEIVSIHSSYPPEAAAIRPASVETETCWLLGTYISPAPGEADSDGSHTSTCQPLSWQRDPLVIQDPFITYGNHAARGLETHLATFSNSYRAVLKAGLPLEPSNSRSLVTRSSVKSLSQALSYNDHSSEGSELTARDAELHSILESCFISKEVHARRAKTIHSVERIVQRKFGKKYRIARFGSTVYDVSFPQSDLDLVILDPDRATGFKPGYRRDMHRKLYNVRILARELKQAGFRNVLSIPGATVPIVKFRHHETGIECDVCINERLGMFCARLIEAYCDATSLLRPMLIVIKRWAKPKGLNDSGFTKPGHQPSFGSHALALMTIGFLQSQGLLPNLQEPFSDTPEEQAGDVIWTHTKKGASIPCDVRYYHRPPPSWNPATATSLREAMRSWFSYWCHEFKPKEQAISIKHGGTKHLDPSKPFSVVVYDPFNITKNVTQGISESVWTRFVAECVTAYNALASGTSLRDLVERPTDIKNRKASEKKLSYRIM